MDRLQHYPHYFLGSPSNSPPTVLELPITMIACIYVQCKHLNSVKPGPERILAPIIGGKIQDFQNLLTPRTPEHCSLLDGRSEEHTSSIQHTNINYIQQPQLTSRARLLCVMIKCEASKQSSCPHVIPARGARSRSQTIRPSATRA